MNGSEYCGSAPRKEMAMKAREEVREEVRPPALCARQWRAYPHSVDLVAMIASGNAWSTCSTQMACLKHGTRPIHSNPQTCVLNASSGSLQHP